MGEFLRSRRERRPAAPGTPPRRTPGWRREEVADQAGVSVAYYTRLEQGKGHSPSAQVLDALADALELDHHERAHLHGLARRAAGAPARAGTSLADPTRTLLDLLPAHAAAYVINPVSDVIACNDVAAALFVGLTAMARPNSVLYVFCEPAARDLFLDWDEIASDSAAHLRAQAGHHPDDPDLAQLIGQLNTDSPDFHREWSRHEVRPKHTGVKHLNHPAAGRLSLDYQVILAAAAPDQRIVTYGLRATTPTIQTLQRLIE